MAETPIACSLTATELGERERAWRTLLQTSLIRHDWVAGGLRLALKPGVTHELRRLVALERECCPWIRFELDGATVTMTSQGDGEQALLGLFTNRSGR